MAQLITRVSLTAQTIANNSVNNIVLDAATFNHGPFTVATTGVTVNTKGICKFTLLLNFFDNNSARVAHTTQALNNAVLVSRVFGENYIRDIANHFRSSIRHIDAYEVDAGEELTFTIESHSITAGATNIVDGWLIMEILN